MAFFPKEEIVLSIKDDFSLTRSGKKQQDNDSLIKSEKIEQDNDSLRKSMKAEQDNDSLTKSEKIEQDNKCLTKSVKLERDSDSLRKSEKIEQDNDSLTKSVKSDRDSDYLKKENEADEKLLTVVYLEAEKKIELRFINSVLCVATDFSDRKDTKSALKRGIYKLFSDYTKKELPWGTLTGIRPTKIPMALLEEGFSLEEIRKNLKEEYLISDEKIDLSIDIAIREKNLLKNIDYKDGYSIYIGIPFCPSTCLYCSFTSYPITKWQKKIDDYLEALFKEIDYTKEAFKDKKLNTIYIGGGTPTTLLPEELDRLLTKVEESFDLQYLQEFTVEAGRPDSITREKLEVLKKHVVTRISINPQTMKEETLRIIGRHHTVQQTRDAYKLAREVGFDNINMDLIIGLPNETIDDVKRTMEEIVELNPENVTVHSLAIKRAARLNMFKEDYADLKIENSEEMMNLTAKYCDKIDLKPYYLYRQKNMAGNFENVGYAKEGKAGIYNILIMEEKQTIVALGAGSTTKRVFTENDIKDNKCADDRKSLLDNSAEINSDEHKNKNVRIERAENVKDIDLYLERIDEMIERKKTLFAKK